MLLANSMLALVLSAPAYATTPSPLPSSGICGFTATISYPTSQYLFTADGYFQQTQTILGYIDFGASSISYLETVSGYRNNNSGSCQALVPATSYTLSPPLLQTTNVLVSTPLTIHQYAGSNWYQASFTHEYTAFKTGCVPNTTTNPSQIHMPVSMFLFPVNGAKTVLIQYFDQSNEQGMTFTSRCDMQ
jgi:hypothetical protein